MLKNMTGVTGFICQERLASFATVDAYNRLHVVPVLFTYDNGKVHVQTDRRSLKVFNLGRNNKGAPLKARGI